MNWSQKIYVNDKSLILTTDREAYIHDHPASAAFTHFDGASIRNYNQAMQHLDRPGIIGAIIEDVTAEVILDQLHAMYHPLDAAGGITFNEKSEILLIYRRGKWDLPKGKRDEGENMEECALREVKEETGLKTLLLDTKVCDTYHIYAQYGEDMLKRTAWYKMKASSTDKLKPQKEENILEARWVKEEDLAPLVARTYEAIKQVLTLTGLNINKQSH
jgi:ADP-ribose pyrophosphatase YjhB (NUDIX family)